VLVAAASVLVAVPPCNALAVQQQCLAAGPGGALVVRPQCRPRITVPTMNMETAETGGPLRDLRGLWGQLVGPSPEADQLQGEAKLPTDPAGDDAFVPLVLVIGATGRTGRLVVRKLVRKGFRVAVLVRSLSSETLNLLGSGVSYSYGDMTDYRSLLDAMEDVDRVIFAADAENEDEELTGLSHVLRSFQDTRTFMYGDAEATKLSLLKMRRDRDFNRWTIEETSAEITERLASAGIGPKPCIAYWKRSPTGAHKNGVFVGKVFDTYLGSATASCSLSGLLVGVSAAPAMAAAAAPAGAAALPGADTATPSADIGAEDAAVDRAVAAAAAAEVPLNLGEYSGLVLRAIGDGNKYTVALRTSEYARSGLEYQCDFVSKTTAFDTIRLPFSNFVPVREGRRVAEAPEMDRRQLMGLAVSFYPQRNNPSQTTGDFYLSVANVKAYRKRDEPEFVYISDAAVHSGSKDSASGNVEDDAEDAEDGSRAKLSRVQAKLRGERLLRSSGLTYFIVRPTELTDEPSSKRLAFTQGEDAAPAAGSVSRGDVAEVVVQSLLDPRACNVACTVTESDLLAPTPYEQDISKALEVLQPNQP